jgi:hypothetical protein
VCWYLSTTGRRRPRSSGRCLCARSSLARTDRLAAKSATLSQQTQLPVQAALAPDGEYVGVVLAAAQHERKLGGHMLQRAQLLAAGSRWHAVRPSPHTVRSPVRCGSVYGLYAGVMLEEMAPGDRLGELVGIADGTPVDGAGVGADVIAPAHVNTHAVHSPVQCHSSDVPDPNRSPQLPTTR